METHRFRRSQLTTVGFEKCLFSLAYLYGIESKRTLREKTKTGKTNTSYQAFMILQVTLESHTQVENHLITRQQTALVEKMHSSQGSCKLMHFSTRHLVSNLQGEKFPCKILSRRKMFLKDLPRKAFL